MAIAASSRDTAAALISGALVGVVTAAGAAGIREHDDLLGAVHECGRLGEIGARRAAFELLIAVAVGDEALGSPGDLGNMVGAEVLDDFVECC